VEPRFWGLLAAAASERLSGSWTFQPPPETVREGCGPAAWQVTGEAAGEHAGLDAPAGFDQQPSQDARGGVKHLVFDDMGALP